MANGYKQKESTLNQNVVKQLNKIEGGFFRKRYGGPMQKGEPDVTGCVFGIRCELEGKLPGKHPTAKQKNSLKRWEKSGAITGVYHSIDEAVAIVHAALIERDLIKPETELI
jgi:hypothetical protein